MIRLYYLYLIAGSTDVTWTNPAAATWSSIEVNVGITCACLPTMKPVLDRLFTKVHQNRQRSVFQPQPERYTQHSRGKDGNEVMELAFNDAIHSQGLVYHGKVLTRTEQV